MINLHDVWTKGARRCPGNLSLFHRYTVAHTGIHAGLPEDSMYPCNASEVLDRDFLPRLKIESVRSLPWLILKPWLGPSACRVKLCVILNQNSVMKLSIFRGLDRVQRTVPGPCCISPVLVSKPPLGTPAVRSACCLRRSATSEVVDGNARPPVKKGGHHAQIERAHRQCFHCGDETQAVPYILS